MKSGLPYIIAWNGIHCSCLQGTTCTSDKFMAEEGLGSRCARHMNHQLSQKLRKVVAHGCSGVNAITSLLHRVRWNPVKLKLEALCHVFCWHWLVQRCQSGIGPEGTQALRTERQEKAASPSYWQNLCVGPGPVQDRAEMFTPLFSLILASHAGRRKCLSMKMPKAHFWKYMWTVTCQVVLRRAVSLQ